MCRIWLSNGQNVPGESLRALGAKRRHSSIETCARGWIAVGHWSTPPFSLSMSVPRLPPIRSPFRRVHRFHPHGGFLPSIGRAHPVVGQTEHQAKPLLAMCYALDPTPPQPGPAVTVERSRAVPGGAPGCRITVHVPSRPLSELHVKGASRSISLGNIPPGRPSGSWKLPYMCINIEDRGCAAGCVD